MARLVIFVQFALVLMIAAEPDAAADAKLAATTKVAPGVSVTMKSVWLGVLFMGFMMAFSGKAWTLNVGFNIVPSVFAAMTTMSSQQKNPGLPQSDYFPIAVGVGVFVVCYFLCYMLHEVFMATCAGFLVALVGVLGVGAIGTPSFPMMSVAAAFVGFCTGAFAGYYYNETEEFNKWIIRLTAGLLMGVSVNAISTGGDIMVTFMNAVSKAREDPGYINDARKASIILLTEWASFAVFTVLGGPIVDCIWDAVADACGCGYRGDGKVADGETGKALAEDVTAESGLAA